MTADEKVEEEIEALLSRDDPESVIDSLLSMPPQAAANDEVWEKVLHARLQERLARKMRDILEGGQETEADKKDSRSAA